MTERPHIRCNQRTRLLHLISILGITTALCATPSFAGDITLLSIGPRIGFGEKIPFMGKEQKYYFHLYDVAAIVKLPWSWPLGEDTWGLETRLIASAGLLTGGNESGLMMTAVPVLCVERLERTGDLRHWSGSRTLQQPYIWCARFRGSGSTCRNLGGSSQSIFAHLCRRSYPTLL